jgi:hypothetical protein
MKPGDHLAHWIVVEVQDRRVICREQRKWEPGE